jgi:DNA adenine methylase
LIRRFAADQDDEVFAALVRRHGPAMLGMCRRRLGEIMADDAFQVVFFTLAPEERGMTQLLTAPLKWHGGKGYLAARIVELMPRHRHYVEPYAGGLAVLLERDPNDRRLWLSEEAGQNGVSELANDLNGEVSNFWRVLRDREMFPDFVRLCQATPLSRPAFQEAGGVANAGPVVAAWAFFVRCRQSWAGSFTAFTSLTRSRTRRGINGNASEWLGAVEGLPAVHSRLWPVVIENVPALELIHREDGEGTLFYLDPPYLHETRATKDVYACEMSEADHRELLAAVTHPERKSKFILSGYRSDLYDQFLAGWRRVEFDMPNHAAVGASKRRMMECVWMNYDPPSATASGASRSASSALF